MGIREERVENTNPSEMRWVLSRLKKRKNGPQRPGGAHAVVEDAELSGKGGKKKPRTRSTNWSLVNIFLG